MDASLTALAALPTDGSRLLPHASAHQVRFDLTAEGLRWYPAQLGNLSRTDLYLLVEVLNQYAKHRSY